MVQLAVALENVGKSDIVLNLGVLLANGKKQLPTAVRLTLLDAANKKHILKGNLGGVAGRVDPFVVPLPAGCRYTLPYALGESAEDDQAQRSARLPPGRYRATAEFTGESVTRRGTNRDMTGLALMRYWTGTVSSGEVTLTVPARR
jgi:hypothetical protein